ncbi:MAG: malonyl-ACP O-methyltransferase BioC [Mariprofundales bacterium]|nr:malonyl-ACP O-methyltransferase BioC [Mariprofundales bacterium]
MESHINPRQVAQAFNLAARHYEQFAALQHEVANRLDAHLNFTKITPKRMVDIGCGTGFLTTLLSKRFPKANLLALDIAPAMAAICKQKIGRRRLPWQPRRMTLCGDANRLPLKDGCCDLVASNLTMQWLPDPVTMLREMRRILAPGGLIIFSTFGRNTLAELRRTLATIDPDKAGLVLPFPDVMSLGDIFNRQAVQMPVTDSDRITLSYADTTALVRELKGMGASARAIRFRSGGLGGRKLLRQLTEHYPRNDEGRIHATFEVLYGQAWHQTAGPEHREDTIPIVAV